MTEPVHAPVDIPDRLFGRSSAFGNEDLWVGGLGPGGLIRATTREIQPDASIGWKLGWWRIAPGTLVITGRRLDAEAPPLGSSVPEGYGTTTGFQATGVSFPTEGCWEITGKAGDGELTFVTFVLAP